MIRADASARIGGGHATRCNALAAVLRARGWRIGFAAVPETWAVVPELGRPGPDDVILDGGEDLDDAVPVGIDLIIVDCHSWDAARERRVRTSSRRVLAIDDIARSHEADMLVDQNHGRRPEDYADRVPEDCRMLLGPMHALLGAHFADTRARAGATVRRIFVGLGRTDPVGATGPVLEGVARAVPDVEIDVMLGGQAPYLPDVRAIIASIGARAALHIDPSDPAGLMANCDLAVGGVGGSAWERCALGLPSLIVVCADNQRAAAIAMERDGAVRLVGDAGNLPPDRLSDAVARAVGDICRDRSARDGLARAASGLCDGRGAARVADAIDAMFAGAQ